MLAYKKYVTIKDPECTVLAGLPFRPGQRVEVLMVAEDDELSSKVQELKTLFRQTQALPLVRKISEEDILEEIKALRAGR